MTPLQWILGGLATAAWAFLACAVWNLEPRPKRLTLNPTAQDFSPT